ncbi:MAG TPA: serine/threonine-protein kinase [bacterium]|nr:protein kinase [Myxococcales bacterium]OQA59153.1 MAG: Serine/threonine-protein kinase Pkn1 [bacterium ADurb.Bin270]HPW46114.1 serine/threonine-protein kinase [bacterium]HQC50758.1 serine/threonine-protein kinase [bacterium]
MRTPEKESFAGYTVTKRDIARGCSSMIHEGLSHDGKIRVAIKILRPSKISKNRIERFKAEYKTLTKLNHPNIAKVLEAGFKEGTPFIISEFIEGKQILSALAGYEIGRMIPIFIELLKGLDFIHRSGMLHLDIKSQNVFVNANAKGNRLKILDFGLAMPEKEYRGEFVGSPSTMAPEIALGLSEKVGKRSDLYSAAVLMYQCLSKGRHPFDRTLQKSRAELMKMVEAEKEKLPAPLDREIPGWLELLLSRMLIFEPEERFYENAAGVIHAISSGRTSEASRTSRGSPEYLVPDPTKLVGLSEISKILTSEIEKSTSGDLPEKPLHIISGGHGMGKSHIVHFLKTFGDTISDRISIHRISFPSDDETLSEKIAELRISISDNKSPILLLIDNLDAAEGKTPIEAEVERLISGIFAFAAARTENPEIYSEIIPTIVAATVTEIQKVGFLKEILASALKLHELKPFTASDITEYLAATPAFFRRQIPSEATQHILKITGGIPLEVKELLSKNFEGLFSFDAAGEIILDPKIIAPSTFRHGASTAFERLLHKIKILDRDEIKLLESIACCTAAPYLEAPKFPLLKRVTGLKDIEEISERLMRAGILEMDRKDRIKFCDEHMPGMILMRMNPADRKKLHSELVKHVSLRWKNFHTAHGEDDKKAIKAAITLGKKMLKNHGDCSAAIKLYTSALKRGSEAHWKLRSYISSLIAAAALNTGDLTRAGEAIYSGSRMIPEGEYPAYRRRFALLDIAMALRAGTLNHAQRLIESSRLIAAKSRLEDYDLALKNYNGNLLYEMAIRDPSKDAKKLLEARKIFEGSKSMEFRLAPHSRKKVMNNLLYSVLTAQGLYEEAARTLEFEISGNKPDIFHLIPAYMAIAEGLRISGKTGRALLWAKRALKLAGNGNSGPMLAYSHAVLANIFYDMDDFQRCLAHCSSELASIACRSAHTTPNSMARIWSMMGRCHGESGNHRKAIVYFEAALASASEGYFAMSAYLGMGEAYLSLGKKKTAMEYIGCAEAMLKTMPVDEISKSHRKRAKQVKKLIRDQM